MKSKIGLIDGRAYVDIRGLMIVGPPGGSCVHEQMIGEALQALSSDQQRQMLDGDLLEPMVFIEGQLHSRPNENCELIE